MRTFAEIFRAPCFVWACVVLAGGCLAAAAAVCAREFLLGLLEQFVRLPPSTKAVIATAVIVATVFAQKPGNVATNLHESARIEEVMPAASAEGSATLNAEEAEARSHGETSTDFTDSHGFEKWVTTNQHESTRIPIRDNSCKFVDETTQGGASATPNAENEEERRHGETSTDFTNSHGSGDGLSTNQHESTQIQIRENPCQSVDVSLCLPTSITSVLSAPRLAAPSGCFAGGYAGNPTLSSNDVVRGYRLEAVRTNAADFSMRPTNARLVGTWHLTDAYRGRTWVRLLSTNQHESTRTSIRENPCQSVVNSLAPFRFPIGSHVVTSLWAHTWGKVRPQLRNASNEIFVIGAPMFARHGQSCLWTAATTNGSVLLTWENFFLGNPYERSLSTDFTDSHGLGDGLTTNLHASAQIPIRDNPCQSVDKNPTSSKITPCLPSSNTSALSDSNPPDVSSTDSTREGIRENPCQSVDHPPVTAQLELFPNGDFIARSNSVERVYRRVNPDDWDDDGIPNDEDAEPFAPADEPQFGPRQTLPEGANTNAYCWVDLVVRRANAKVTFAGDGASNLSDPAFIAEADATNRVTLLIGKTYRVTCPMPFEVAGKSSDDIEESWERDEAALWLHWPVRIGLESSGGLESLASTNLHESTRMSATFSDSNLPLSSFSLLSTFQTIAKPSKLPKPFTMHVTPAGLGGAFTWTNVCCRVSGDGYTFSITCGNGCSCGGCSVTGYLEYEGYRLPAFGGFCGCGGYVVDHPGGETDPDEKPPLPGASATFSKRVVFFEDDYENAPGETVPWQSTETRLDCWAYGGTRGGHVRIEIAGADGLVPYGGSPLPFERDLEPGEEVSFKTTYRAVKPSGGKDDIVVTATFTENETGWTETTVDKATAVQVTVRPRVHAPENDKEYRHKFGIGEIVDCGNQPKVESVRWKRNGGGTLKESNGSYEYRCPLSAEVNGFEIAGEGCCYVPQTRVVEPQGVLARDAGYATAPKIRSGQAGGILLAIDLYVLPLDVSFSGIRIEEIPDVGGSHSGYFADTFFMSEWFHGEDQGAGDWREVYGNNKFLNDEAGFKRALPQLDSRGFVSTAGTNGWTNGNLTWEVPCGWADSNVQKGDDPIGTFSNGSRQVMTIDAKGNVEVQKHGNAVRREIGGGIILNGVRVQ